MFDSDGNGKIDVVELCYMFQIEYRRKDGGKNFSKVLYIVALDRIHNFPKVLYIVAFHSIAMAY